eukprot:SAG31_NODE_24408_length_482_cov_0.809399_1_plen_43_part_10
MLEYLPCKFSDLEHLPCRNLDDLWSGGRYPNGSIYADPKKFPS